MGKKVIQSLDNDLKGYGAIPVNDYVGLSGDVQGLTTSLAEKAQQSDLDNQNNLYKSIITSTQKVTGYVHIAGGIDSLTDGAGGISYRGTFCPRMRGQFGYGGDGYIGFNAISGVDAYGNVNSTGFSLVSGLTTGQGVSLYSLDFKGIYATTPTGSETFSHDLSLTYYDTITLFYLKQPSGGSFNVYYKNDKTNTQQTVNTLNATYDIGSITVGMKRGTGGITIDTLTGGAVCIYGLFLKNVNGGFIFSKIGKGGDQLAWHNNCDAGFRSKWLNLLNPDIFIFNGGTNDKSNLSATQFNTVLQSYLQPYVSSNVQVLICRPNAVNGTGEAVMESYEPYLISFAQQNKTDYIDFSELLGDDYTTANSLGYMQGDGTHPSNLGCAKIANALLTKLAVPHVGTTFANGVDPNPTSLVTNLSVQQRTNIAVGTPVTLYSLGFKNSWTNGFVELEVSGCKYGATSVRKKTFKCYFQCATVLNNCYATGGTATADVFTFYADGNAHDLTFTATLTGGLLVIQATPTVYAQNIIATGKVTYSSVGSGKNVWEN